MCVHIDANRTLSQTELRAQITVWSGNSTRNEYEIISNRPCGQKLHTVRSQLSYGPVKVVIIIAQFTEFVKEFLQPEPEFLKTRG